MRLHPGLLLRKVTELARLWDFGAWYVIKPIRLCRVRAGKFRGQRMGVQSSLESPGPLEEMKN